MSMIRDTACALTLAISITRHGGKVGVQRGANRAFKDWHAVFGAEDNVDEKDESD